MEFSELVAKRQSVRDYDPSRPVPREVLVRILEAGRLAPSAANLQPWKFIIIESEPELKRVRAAYQRGWFHRAPQILAVSGSKEACWKRASDGYSSLETDLAIAMDHLILAAANEGIATCWIAAFDPIVLREALELKEDEEVFAITPLGYPPSAYSTNQQKQRKDFSGVVEFR